MSLARTQIRAQARANFRANEIVEGKCKVGKTKKLRVALAGNNPSTGKRVFQAQKRVGRMVRHARLVTSLLIRAAGGDAPSSVTTETLLTPFQDRIERLGTTITRGYPVTVNPNARRNRKTAERRERESNSRGQRIAKRGKIAAANKRTLADLAAGKYGPSATKTAEVA